MQTPSENTDVKLGTLNEPSAHLIEENVALPKEIFHSHLSYSIYEMAHCTPIKILALVIGVLVLIIIFFHDNDVCTIISGISLLTSIIILMIVLIAVSVEISDRDFKIKLLLEVITRKPAGKGWRAVAYNMNQYLFDEGLWYTPYYFYCGRKCQCYFNGLIKIKELNTYPSSSMNDEENTQPGAQPDMSANEVARSYIYSPDPILEAYFVKAAEIDKEAQREYWKRQYPEAALP
ncbi:DUP/COS family protein SPAR_A00760 [Saccharomyces paradoxus]|uniref:DUP/COS family protein n=1 Tax=Saccharomyces paradoxus TaxID=27291 RepID=A0A8B8UL25_SACPA|nr:uncharacterized protein SPAR_A00760 [Saccharomyces paradoxus]QHS71452.1 hypothetical protein SPAR_A00760 [Saccharomyces paradoxus]